jgi:GTP-binding protein
VKLPHPLVGAEFVTGAAEPGQLPAASVPEIAFAGRSNAGKSTAINVLAGRTRLAFASRTPGRTQQINLFSLRSGGLVADLPGYGYAAVGKEVKRAWQDFLWHYITTRPTLVALVLIVDARHGLKDLDLELLKGFVPSGRPVLLLATKADKLNTTAKRETVVAIGRQVAEAFPLGATNVTVQLFSATARIGIEEAEAVIAGWL